MMRTLAVTAMVLAASTAWANLYEATFEGGLDAGVTVGSSALVSDPVVVNYNGSDQLCLSVPDTPFTTREFSTVNFTFPAPIDLNTVAWPITVSMDITLTAAAQNQFGQNKRHNVYFDFDNSANDYGDQTINDGGGTKMIALPGRSEINIGGDQSTESVVTMAWTFDDPAGLVDTMWGATPIDTDLPGTLDSMTPNAGLFESFTLDLVKDFRDSTAGYTIYLDNFVVTPEPTTLALLAMGLVGLIRRR